MMNLVAKMKRTLLASRVLRTAGRLAPAGAVILAYHSVQHEPQASADTISPAIVHSASAFEQQMAMIARDFTPITLEDLRLFLAGRGRLPCRPVAVTFDDGFRDNFEVAAPILARHGIRATFYVTAGWVESGSAPWFCRLRHAFETGTARQWFDPTESCTWDLSDPVLREEAQLAAMRSCAVLTGERQEEWVGSVERDLGPAAAATLDGVMLTWAQVQSLHGQGHLIGSHSLTHPNLAHIPLAEAHREIHESKRLLEQHLGEPVRPFSYHCAILWPHWNAETAVLTREAGYDTVTTTATGRVGAGADRLLLPRVVAPPDLEGFRWAVEISLLGHKV